MANLKRGNGHRDVEKDPHTATMYITMILLFVIMYMLAVINFLTLALEDSEEFRTMALLINTLILPK